MCKLLINKDNSSNNPSTNLHLPFCGEHYTVSEVSVRVYAGEGEVESVLCKVRSVFD